MRWHDPDASFVEAVLSRGDRRTGAAIEAAWRAGARFDGWTEHFDLTRWENALREAGVDPGACMGPLDAGAGLPWDHIDLGVARGWLLVERQSALEGKTTADCRGGTCSACGLACGQARATTPGLDPEAWDALRERLAGAFGPANAHAAGESGEVRRYRVSFAKTGRLRFISHLETTRLLARILRMAGWPLAYSSGHHPLPKFAYGPPLPLGVEGERELFDVALTCLLDECLLAAANARFPEGLALQGFSPLPAGSTSLAALAVEADYRVHVPEDLADQARREARAEAFAEAGAVVMLKASKGRQKTIDLKRSVARLAWEDACVLGLRLRLQEQGSHVAGPLPTLREVFKWSAEALARCRVMRTGLFDARGDPLA